MKIGLISPPWLPVPPPAYGGSEAVVDRLARGLAAEGHHVLLAAPGDSTCPVPRVAPIPVAATDRMGAAVVELAYVIGAYAAMRDVDLVHDHTLAGPHYRSRPRGVPVVTTNHLPFTGEYNDIYCAMGDDVHVVAISAHQASLARGVRIAQVIHHGLDVADVPVGSGQGGYAVFLGRMSPEKGPREAVLAAREAGVPLVLAGPVRQPEAAYFAEQVEPLLGPGTEYIGEVDAEERYRLLGEATALLNPAQWDEPFGLVMIEALACGTPVVATPRGSVPELIDDGRTGLIRSDQSGLAQALHDVAGLDRSACRRAAERRFSAERMVGDHIRLYQEVCARVGGSAADRRPHDVHAVGQPGDAGLAVG